MLVTVRGLVSDMGAETVCAAAVLVMVMTALLPPVFENVRVLAAGDGVR